MGLVTGSPNWSSRCRIAWFGSLAALSSIARLALKFGKLQSTRHIIFSIDAGDKAPSYLLRDYISMEGLARSADGGWGYDYIGQELVHLGLVFFLGMLEEY